MGSLSLVVPMLHSRRIDDYNVRLGGVQALRENDRNVARQIDIMERRIVKAQVRQKEG